ncbi:MAG: plasmid stabilization protein [Alphaproteobacteria bacterium CG_4_10_14_0_2_um_filter_63_37]|nr:MAG: hypothetical protein AUJ55_08855 [Proteobacteria bacterium CG1_02_64_396]PJA24824.1 MAG: plasmid stabilization protein [Alphaproteobacteria bacterium CG_4_10_14_0_2_um_filter_63_37]
MNILYAPEAIEDLQCLRGFIAPNNPLAAQQAAAAILKGIAQLRTFPLLGAEVRRAPKPEMVRDLVIGRYIARYLVGRNEIHVLRIWHHKESR